MSPVAIWELLKSILPTKRIAAWILGVLAAILALVMGVNQMDLKAQFCANDVVTLPKIAAPAANAQPAPAAQVPVPASK